MVATLASAMNRNGSPAPSEVSSAMKKLKNQTYWSGSPAKRGSSGGRPRSRICHTMPLWIHASPRTRIHGLSSTTARITAPAPALNHAAKRASPASVAAPPRRRRRHSSASHPSQASVATARAAAGSGTPARVSSQAAVALASGAAASASAQRAGDPAPSGSASAITRPGTTPSSG